MTVNTLINKKIICQAVLDYYPHANLAVKINSLEEKKALDGIAINSFVHAQHEAAMLLVKKSLAPVTKPSHDESVLVE